MAAKQRSRWAVPTYGAAAAVFGAAGAGLVVQVSRGADPALGAEPVAAIPQPHYIVTRRVVRTRVVVRRVRDLPPLATPAPVVSAPVGAGAATGAVGVASAAAAPVAAAPAAPVRSGSSASAAPAPAPAPAPVSAPTTRAS